MNYRLKSKILAPFNLMYRISPELTLRVLFRIKLGYRLDLEAPRSLNEKIQWIKLHDKNPLFPACSDKYAVRAYVASKGFGYLLNELLWQGDNPDDIPFDSLPEKYVVKATHGSTFNVICDGSKPVDRAALRRTCRTWLKTTFLPCYGEWFYGVIPPRILVERYLEDDDLPDCKIYCCNGIPRFVALHEGRFSHHTSDLFDTDWNHMRGVSFGCPNAEKPPQRPACLAQMLACATTLSEDFALVRVDFYLVGGRPVFGELTFTDGAGFDRFDPRQADFDLGSFLTLPVGPGAPASSESGRKGSV